MKPRVWVNKPSLSDEILAPLSGLAEVTIDGNQSKLIGATVVIIGLENADSAFMDRVGPQLQLLIKTGIGLDNFDIPAATERGILVCNNPDAPTESTAEHAIGLLLATAKRIVAGDMQLRGADIARAQLEGTEVRGRTLGVLGYGRIGRRVAEICALGLKMSVLVYDPFVDPNQPTPPGITFTDNLDTIFAQADFVTVHTSLTAETRHLVGERQLRLLKRGSYLINTSRGPVIDEAALIKVLQEGHLAGAGLDVFDPEPPQADNPLLNMPNVVVTPHLGPRTDAGFLAIWNGTISQIVQHLQGERPTFLANPEAWPGRVGPRAQLRRGRGMKIVNAKQLSQQVSQLFVAAGTPEDIAQLVADSLVLSDMMGYASHGVIRVNSYLDRIKQGSLVPAARPVLVRETAVTGLVDGQDGLGQLTAQYGATLACEKAEAEGLAAVGLFNCRHVGRLGEWVTLAAARGLIGLAFCSSGPPGGLVTPFGGAGRVFGTNPIAAAIPAPDRPPLVIDFATSVSAEGKLMVARNLGQPVPTDTILNRNGQPSTNPADYFEGGLLLPVGGHKGSALALLVDVLGGIITGAGCASFEGSNLANGVLFLMLNPGIFQTYEAIERDLSELLGTIKATPPAAGFEEVLLPGEPEQRKLAQQREAGVRVDETTWENLQTAAQELGVSFSLSASQ